MVAIFSLAKILGKVVHSPAAFFPGHVIMIITIMRGMMVIMTMMIPDLGSI